MATTGFWPIKGSLRDVIKYADNPDETTNPKYLDDDLAAVLKYAENDDKTDMKMFVSGINCLAVRAYEQMMITKRHYGKMGGNVAYHGYQSFKSGEVTPKEAHDIGLETARRMWGKDYEIVVTTHLNTDNIHNHIVINSVSFKTGMKFENHISDHIRLREISDAVCKEYGKSVIEGAKFYNAEKNAYWVHKHGGKTRRDILREDVDDAINNSANYMEFVALMKNKGYIFSRSEMTDHPSVKALTWERAIRFDKLGDDYKKDKILERIFQTGNRAHFNQFSEPYKKTRAKYRQTPLQELEYQLRRVKYMDTLEALFYLFMELLKPSTDAQSPYRHGHEVTVLPIPSNVPDTYIFAGWNSVAQEAGEDVVVINNNTFTMPRHNVRLVGNFAAATNVPYKIRHLTQKEDLSGYDVYREVEYTGSTEEWVTAYALIIPGFRNVTTDGNDILSVQTGQIPGVGTLTIDFYYDRNLHSVTYQYEGIAPEGAPQVPDAIDDVPFGKEVAVADAPEIPGYTFVGWYIDEDTTIVTSFDMPDNDVVLKGKFSSNLVNYTVNYWLQNIDDAEYTLDSSYTEEAFVDQHIEAIVKSYTGFSLNTSESKTFDHVTVDEDGVGNLVLNLYYDRHTYDVIYGYYGEQPEGTEGLLPDGMQNVRYGTPNIPVEGKLTLEGYSFDGWYTRTATVTDNKFTMPDQDVTFLGRFVKQFTVSYDLNNGTGAEGVDYSAEVVDAGTQITVKAAPTRSGYTFKGWVEGSNEFDPDEVITVDRNVHLVAKWSRNGGGGGVTTRYTLTYETNGGNEIAKETYNSGVTAKLTKVPVKEGYVFEGWHLDEALTEEVTEVKMTKNITVYAAWVEDNGNAGNGHETPDSLNGEDHFAYVVGYPDGTVRPNDNISRAEVTAIFFRLLKPDEVREQNLTDENGFADVNTADWYNTAISTMAKLGIVNGRTEESFVPNAFITRAEFAAICARFDDSEFEVVDNFTDVAGHWAEHDIHEAAAHGWIRGYEDGTFKPDQFITRAEAMTMINRVLNRVPETVDDLLDNMIKWPDNSDETAWYYLPIQEATNSHDYDMKNHIYEKWTALREVTDWTKYE